MTICGRGERGVKKLDKSVDAFYERSLNQNANVIYLSNAKVLCLSIHIFFQSCNSPRLDIRSQTFTNNDLLFFSPVEIRCKKRLVLKFKPVEAFQGGGAYFFKKNESIVQNGARPITVQWPFELSYK